MQKLKVNFLSGPAYLDPWDIVKKNEDGSLIIDHFGIKTITPDMYELISMDQYKSEREQSRTY